MTQFHATESKPKVFLDAKGSDLSGLGGNADILAGVLPEVEIFFGEMGHKNAWSDHYGAMELARTYCGVSSFPFFNGVWQHGCFGPWQDQTPHIHVYNAPGAQGRRVFVAREDEVDLLKRNGYRSVNAIGLPFCYVPEVRVERRQGTLLVVPTHSLEISPFESEAEMVSYASYIHEIAHRFTKVIVCVHPSCLKNGHWIKQFADRGYHCVVGAQKHDKNALLRMKTLFSHFEYVTTNGWGSHVAYALSCGAKLSIIGDAPARSVTSVAKDPGWGGNEAEMAVALSSETSARRDAILGKFMLPPINGVADREFGDYLIGRKNMVGPDLLKRHFGWNMLDAGAALFRTPRVYYNGVRNKGFRFLRSLRVLR